MIIGRRIAALSSPRVAVAGCAHDRDRQPGSRRRRAASRRRSGGEGAPVDACKLLEPAEVQDLIGANDGGKGSPGAASICTWKTADELSVTVDVGQAGTAVNGLPAWDPALGPEKPLPDGMRSLSGGQVQFVAGTRDCAVQVVTDPFSKDDEQKAVALAKVVQSRL